MAYMKILPIIIVGIISAVIGVAAGIAYSPTQSQLTALISDNDELVSIDYPMSQQPDKIKSINMDKNPEFNGILTGIKGQYLIFDNEYVLNVRKYTGYIFNLDINK